MGTFKSETTVVIHLFVLMIGITLFPKFSTSQGFGEMNALGQNGTTGGSGGTTVTVTSTSEFLDYIGKTESTIIQVDGPIHLSQMERVESNKTIIGVGSNGIITGGGLNLSNVSNIIIRNMFFKDSNDDAINLQTNTHHVWIDHCDLTSSHDGLIDIKHGADYITVSWNHFTNHQKTCLLGHSNNNASQDTGHLRVTYHHNWFDNTGSRHPRVRFSALCHVYNNYYLGNDYGVASTCDAEVLVENNYFKNVGDPTHVGYGSSWEGDLVERNNIFDNCDHVPETKGTIPLPPYVYGLDDGVNVPSIVQAGVGRDGFRTIDGEADDIGWFPDQFTLAQNYPNPFNPETMIGYSLGRPGFISLRIFNSQGCLVETLVNGYQNAGQYIINWQSNGCNRSLTSGFYFARLKTGLQIKTIKMVLMR